MNRINWTIYLLILLMIVGCNSDVEPNSQNENGSDTSTTTPPVEVDIPVDLKSLVDSIIEDLSAQLSVSEDEISIVYFVPVTWQDGSLGCPQPDAEYNMALVEGYQFELVAEGQRYFYHTGNNNSFVLCEEAERLDSRGVPLDG